MNTKSRTISTFDSAATERAAMAIIRAARKRGMTWRAIGKEIEADPCWALKLCNGEISDPGLHRIGRVIERLG